MWEAPGSWALPGSPLPRGPCSPVWEAGLEGPCLGAPGSGLGFGLRIFVGSSLHRTQHARAKAAASPKPKPGGCGPLPGTGSAYPA